MVQEHIVKILSIEQIAPAIKCFRVEKPLGFSFISGHSVMVAVPHAPHEKRSYSFTSTNADPYLEFHIKRYPALESFTHKLHALHVGDTLLLAEMFGSIRYTGKGVFIAGGQGITPFLSMLRTLKQEGKLRENMLLHSVKTSADLICERELREMLGSNFFITLTQEKISGYMQGRITRDMLSSLHPPPSKNFYILGPDDFVTDMHALVASLKNTKDERYINNLFLTKP